MEIDELLLLFVGEDKKWDEQKFVDILNDLSRLSLIQSWYRDENNRCHLSLHPLVQDWIRVRASSELCYDSAVLGAYVVAKVLKQCYSHHAYTMPLSLRQELLSHLSLHGETHELMITLKKDEALSKYMLYRCYLEFTRFYFASYLYGESEKVARQWAVASSRKRGPEDVGTLMARKWLSSALSAQNHCEEAFHIDREVLEFHIRKHGSKHPNVLADTHNFACRLMERGQLARAERVFRRVIEINERVLGHDDIRTLASVFALGRVLQIAGKYADAEALCRNLVHDSQRIFGSNHTNTISDLELLAVVLNDQGKYSESQPYFETVYAHRLAKLGPNNPRTILSKDFCAILREKIARQLRREQRKARRVSTTSQTSDSESDTESEVSELGDESIFSTYERNLLWSFGSDTEQSLYLTSEGEEGKEEEKEESEEEYVEEEEEDADSTIGTKSEGTDIQIPEALKDGREASEESLPEE